MAKFTKSPIQTFNAEESETPTLDAIMGFVENEAIYVIMIAIIVIFIGTQFSRWALKRDWGDPEGQAKDDRRLR